MRQFALGLSFFRGPTPLPEQQLNLILSRSIIRWLAFRLHHLKTLLRNNLWEWNICPKSQVKPSLHLKGKRCSYLRGLQIGNKMRKPLCLCPQGLLKFPKHRVSPLAEGKHIMLSATFVRNEIGKPLCFVPQSSGTFRVNIKFLCWCLGQSFELQVACLKGKKC